MRHLVLRIMLVFMVVSAGVPAAAQAQAQTADAASLLVRATRALDLKEVERLQRAYGYYIDHSDWDNVVDLLSDDAEVEYAASGVYVGKKSISALLYAIGYGERGLQP